MENFMTTLDIMAWMSLVFFFFMEFLLYRQQRVLYGNDQQELRNCMIAGLYPIGAVIVWIIL